MERVVSVDYLKGDVVVVPFPFSDLSNSKRRPALVAADLKGEDLILCQITSRSCRDDYSVFLGKDDFEQGSLRIKSSIRPNKIFTADKSIILYKAGSLRPEKIKEVEDELVGIFSD